MMGRRIFLLRREILRTAAVMQIACFTLMILGCTIDPCVDRLAAAAGGCGQENVFVHGHQDGAADSHGDDCSHECASCKAACHCLCHLPGLTLPGGLSLPVWHTEALSPACPTAPAEGYPSTIFRPNILSLS